MRTVFGFFAASRYWTDREALQRSFAIFCNELQSIAETFHLIVDGEGVDTLPRQPGDVLVIVPMSGAVQKDILRAAEQYAAVVLYAGYIQGNADRETCHLLLKNNAAPTLMDCWSVLRKRHPNALLALNAQELSRRLRVLGAYARMQGARLLLIGEPEPWVISVSRDLMDYRRLGLDIRQIPQQELADEYARTGEEAGRPYAEKYLQGARECVEPTAQEVLDAGRMAAALCAVLDRHEADGVAIACFNLLSLGTTSCLGVSFVNDCSDKVAACEGDLDSAVTMLMLKPLADTKLWMANPGLHPKGMVNFSHCTAPLDIDATGDRPYALRNHHESGIGASLQVDLPTERRVTACRISGRYGSYTVQGATLRGGPHEPCCRTQAYVEFDDFDRYLATALGCHQVFCFEDAREDFALLARMMGLTPEGEGK